MIQFSTSDRNSSFNRARAHRRCWRYMAHDRAMPSVQCVYNVSRGSFSIADSPLWNETWTDRLKQNLLANYDKFARPSQHWETTRVNVKLNVQTVEVDDMLNVMAANVWVVMTWNDDKLQWNSTDYSGLKSINLGAHEIWLPDIYLLNSAAHGMEYYGDRHCIVNEIGIVLWVTPTIFHGYCHLDFTFWPFEMNTCRLSLSSWTYDGTQLDLKLLGSGVDVSFFNLKTSTFFLSFFFLLNVSLFAFASSTITSPSTSGSSRTSRAAGGRRSSTAAPSPTSRSTLSSSSRDRPSSTTTSFLYQPYVSVIQVPYRP
ncbi:unnamed protein product [Trichogramma brassicae]|uniref:Neurotransmitter-gated ion-channel ligand-binding domain-containing protein n=1 Tax=Trichogramma brassicae TaxID=86971 RepID=A0A6H5I418_9HYME|nr:unnamed protein product [Trichogramma brassicae]